MILYLGTSTLVKGYVAEETETVERAVEEAESVDTSVVAYAETRSALARKERDGAPPLDGHREAVASLDEEWEAYKNISVTKNVARLAGGPDERHALRGFRRHTPRFGPAGAHGGKPGGTRRRRAIL